jgi:hypothetical protein
MHFRRWISLALFLALTLPGVAKERVWTSSDGRTMRGEFVRELDGDVTFLVGGKLQTVPLSRLSERDQQIVRDLAAGKPVPDDPAPPPATDDPFTGPPATATAPATGDAPAADEPLAPAADDRPPPLVNKPKPPVTRVWTDNQGRQTTGKFVRVFDGKVVLSRAGGPISVPFFDLSEADQQYVKDQLTAAGQEEQIPVRTPAQETPSTDDPAESPMPQPLPEVQNSGPPGRVAGGPRGPGAGGPRGPIARGPRGPGVPGARGPGAPEPRFGPGRPGGIGSGRFGPGRFGPDPFGPGDQGSSADTNRIVDTLPQSAESGPSTYQEPVALPATSTRRVPVCTNCQARLSEVEAQGASCPQCGARWSFNLYSNSGSSASTTTTSSTAKTRSPTMWEEFAPETKRAVFHGTLVVVVLVVLTALVIGVIAVILNVASASRAGRQYRDL